MKHILMITSIIILLCIVIILSFNNTSYSLIKDFFIKKDIRSISDHEEQNIVDIEDLIFIPKIKNFKKIFLKKINTSHLITVNIPENILYLHRYNWKKKDYSAIKQYPVAVGKKRTPSPIGEGIVYTKGRIFFRYKYGTNTGKIVTHGDNKYGIKEKIPYEKMFGLYMIVNQTDAYVIHSTTEDWLIGEPVSGGCVRMLIPDMLELYPYIDPPIKVIINYSLFKLENDLLTVYPDIYNKYISINSAFIDFLKENKINPIIFSDEKIKKAFYSKLPATISLNDLLHDYFVERKITFNKIQIEYKDVLQNVHNYTKIDEIIIQYKR